MEALGAGTLAPHTAHSPSEMNEERNNYDISRRALRFGNTQNPSLSDSIIQHAKKARTQWHGCSKVLSKHHPVP